MVNYAHKGCIAIYKDNQYYVARVGVVGELIHLILPMDAQINAGDEFLVEYFCEKTQSPQCIAVNCSELLTFATKKMCVCSISADESLENYRLWQTHKSLITGSVST